jgi:hypothetical protein
MISNNMIWVKQESKRKWLQAEEAMWEKADRMKECAEQEQHAYKSIFLSPHTNLIQFRLQLLTSFKIAQR